MPSSIVIPKTWLDSYEDFVKNNTSQVSQIESALRSLTYILPGRFNESELASESLHTTINLLSTYHTSLLPPPSHPLPHTRYTSYQRSKSKIYTSSSTLLRTIQYTELLCEMFFKRRGGDKLRWRLIVFLEFIKLVCRALMLRVTGWRTGINPANPEQRASEEETSPSPSETDDDPVAKPYQMPRTHHILSPLPSAHTPIPSFLSTRIVSPDAIRHASLLVRRLTTYRAQAAETLYILRPLIYALAMQRLQGKNRDWRPWILGLAIEVSARQLAKSEIRKLPGGLAGMTAVEREEWKRRGWSVAWWGMRGAFYENVTRYVYITAIRDD
ncbi:MAG: hypothetical protein Q9195_008419 [Heterodermia aff. obscurata]